MNTLSRLNLWWIKATVLLIFLSLLIVSCKKDGQIVPTEEEQVSTDTVQPKISFVFVNHLGYRADSNAIRWLHAVNLHSKYYNPVANFSWLVNIVYNRNRREWPALTDSIEHKKYIAILNANYSYEVTLVWYYPHSSTGGREMRFQTKNWPSVSDTVKVLKDTVIKFVYPDDTLPNNKFIRVK